MGCTENCLCKQVNRLKCCYVALPNISGFQKVTHSTPMLLPLNRFKIKGGHLRLWVTVTCISLVFETLGTNLSGSDW